MTDQSSTTGFVSRDAVTALFYEIPLAPAARDLLVERVLALAAPAVQAYPEVPEGYKLVIVPQESTDEPDWDECKRQAEVVTGLKVEQHTFSILKREVRRWIASLPAAQSADAVDAVTEFNVGRYCLSEDDCIADGINFAAYERGVADAAAAFARNNKGANRG